MRKRKKLIQKRIKVGVSMKKSRNVIDLIKHLFQREEQLSTQAQ